MSERKAAASMWNRAMAGRVQAAASQASALTFGTELVRAPAAVMALGICLLFAVPFLLGAFLNAGLTSQTVRLFSWLLVGFAALVVWLFASQLLRRPSGLWGYTAEHFAIGTWVAATNVLARVVAPISRTALIVLTAAGWALLGLYAYWLAGMVARGAWRRDLNGTVFLTTVAPQSAVLASLEALGRPSDEVLWLLLGVNIVGIVVYALWFPWVWIVPGLGRQLAAWRPTNNITHGALSISILAAEAVLVRMAPQPPALRVAIEALWAVVALLFVTAALIEVSLLAVRRADLARFRVANYARNFTFGMFFACTYYGATYLPGSLMDVAVSRALLVCLAALVVGVNVLEVARHAVAVVRAAMAAQEARTA